MSNTFHSRPELTANGTTPPIGLDHAIKAVVTAVGTFDTGTATVEVTVDGTNWAPYPNGALTASGVVIVEAPIKAARVTLAGATAPSVFVGFGVQS